MVNRKGKRQHVRGRFVDRGRCQKETFVIVVKGRECFNVLTLPSMPKGDNVEYGFH